MNITARQKHGALFAAIMALAIVLRLHDLALRPLWLDELFSAWFIKQDWHFLWSDLFTRIDPHPPLYYSLLKLWSGFGNNEFTLRLLSVVFAVATVPLVYCAGRVAGGGKNGPSIGLLAAFLFATDKLELFYAQDARPYACFLFAMALAVLPAVWLVRHPVQAETPTVRLGSDRRALVAFVGLGFGLALLQWFQNVGVVFILPIGLFLIGWWWLSRRRTPTLFVNLALSVLLMALLYAPFLPSFIRQSTTLQTGFWLTRPTATYLTTQTMRLFGQSLDGVPPPARLALYCLTIVPIAALCLPRLLRRQEDKNLRPLVIFLLCASFGAWLVNLALTFTMQPIFMERTMLPLQVPWFILLAMMPFAFDDRRRTIVLGVLLALFTAGAGEYWFLKDTAPNGLQRPWKELVQTIAAKDPSAPVIAVPNQAAMCMEYYEQRLGTHFDMHALPAPFPAVDSHYIYPIGGGGVPQITPDSVTKVMRDIGAAPQVWLVTHGATLDPKDEVKFEPDRLIDKALAKDYSGAVVYRDRSATLVLYTRK